MDAIVNIIKSLDGSKYSYQSLTNQLNTSHLFTLVYTQVNVKQFYFKQFNLA